MDLPEIKALIAAMASSDLAEMEVSKDGWTLRLIRRLGETRPAASARAAVPAAAPEPERPRSADPAPAPGGSVVSAPLTGIVHLSPSPGEAAFVSVGQSVGTGAILCLVEAMKVFNRVQAERGGTIDAVLVASGDEVEAGQPLFRFA